MTTTILTFNISSTFNIAAKFDQLVLSTGVGIAATTNPAIQTAFGLANVIVDGSAYGTKGFYDSSAMGGDIVTVGQSGSLVGVGGDGILINGGASRITNAGLIDGTESAGIVSGFQTTIVNQGLLEGYYEAINDAGNDTINNYGLMTSLSSASDDTIYEGSGNDTIFNTGVISSRSTGASVYLNGGANAITNSGTISGGNIALDMEDGDDVIVNSGTISGLINGIIVHGTAGYTSIDNTGLIATTYPDRLAVDFLDTEAHDALTNSGRIIGGVQFYQAGGAFLDNSGAIEGNVNFENSSLGDQGATFHNSGSVSGSIYFSGDNNTYQGAAGTLEGAIFCAGSNGVYIGGAHGTTFVIAATQLAATDTIVGGASADDRLDFTGTGLISARALKNVSGFETLSLGASESIVIRESVADTASGHALTIDTLANDTVNLASVTSTTDSITVWGAAGDIITAGPSLDAFGFASAGASTGSGYDLIAGVNFARDKFDVTTSIDAVAGINAAVTKGSLSTATFNADLAADLGSTKLGADHAVLFTASAGTLKGDTFLVVDLNGAAGYQANADLVIHLTGAMGTLSKANFI